MAFAFLMILGIVGGAALIGSGLRGKLIDDHPLCAKCGFDLTGKPEESDRCGECGAYLSRNYSVRIGHRARRTRLLWLGVLIFLPSILFSVLSLMSGLGQFNPQPWKPTALLTWEASYGGPATRTSALAELFQRLHTGKLSQSWIDSITAEAMRRQIDPAATWSDGWADFVSAAFKNGKISKDTWATFARQGMKLSLVVRPTVCVGDFAPVSLKVDGSRMGKIQAFAAFTWRELTIGGIPSRKLSPDTGYLNYSSKGWGGSYPVANTDGMTAQLPPGMHPVNVKLHMQILDGSRGAKLDDFDMDLSSQISIVPKDAEVGLFKIDESQRRAVEASVQPPTVAIMSDGNVRVNIRVHSPPVIVSMRPTLRLPDGKERQLVGLPIEVTPNTNYSFPFLPFPAADLGGAATVDLILRPDAELVRRSLDMSPRWGDPIIIRNISVERPPMSLISTRPSATIPTQ